MNDLVIERFARRLLKCPFDQQIFDSSNSALDLRLHLGKAHAGDISQHHRVRRTAGDEPIERPVVLYCCPRCEFVAPPGDPLGSITRHITAKHPKPHGPVAISFRISKDEDVIGNFVEQQGSIEVCVCTLCNEVFADVARTAEHWVQKHCDGELTVEEARHALDENPEKFRVALLECLVEVAEEEVRRRLSIREPDDGYQIRHSPNVPRVRSAPSESIIYVEHEPASFLDQEIDELFSYEGLDGEDYGPLGQHQTVRVEIRFSNIEDGYIPLTKEVRSILPLLSDGEMIEVSWADRADTSFDCKVSKSKRAIYNMDGRLKDLFEDLPSGVWLHIEHSGSRRYRIWVRHSPHIVANCKIFIPTSTGGWDVVRRDERVEWETSDHVFKHQLTFEQMQALRAEAQQTGLRIKDAVYEVMKCLAQTDAVHVRDIYDAVFWRMRTCSLAAVWAQFRPEHTCYKRVRPGYYLFDPSQPRPPSIRTTFTHRRREDAPPGVGRESGRYVVRQRNTWRFNVFKRRFEEELNNDQNACLVVRCAFGTPGEISFVIPIRDLQERVLARAHCHDGGRYMFTVNPHDYVFKWDYNVDMPGRPYLE